MERQYQGLSLIRNVHILIIIALYEIRYEQVYRNIIKHTLSYKNTN